MTRSQSSIACSSRRPRPSTIIAASAVGLVVLCFVVWVWVVGKPKAEVNASEVLAAITNFCAAHRPLPQTVTFSQLISQGYLGSNVLKSFGASEVTVFLNADETHPQNFLMDALMPDGSHTTVLSDGSVQGFSKSRFQQSSATNGRSASPAVDSGASGAGRPR